ncbi:hypothetical protein WG66_008081 [Moniliophthora roreri]|nr:hypothetical protein WG66_008081 [Moniliophthora roreri]
MAQWQVERADPSRSVKGFKEIENNERPGSVRPDLINTLSHSSEKSKVAQTQATPKGTNVFNATHEDIHCDIIASIQALHKNLATHQAMHQNLKDLAIHREEIERLKVDVFHLRKEREENKARWEQERVLWRKERANMEVNEDIILLFEAAYGICQGTPFRLLSRAFC